MEFFFQAFTLSFVYVIIGHEVIVLVRSNEDFRLKRLHDACFKDLTGKRFGRLTVTAFAYMSGKVSFWKCRCDCGNDSVVRGVCLSNGHTKSCGCLHKKALLKDLTGKKFNQLTVLSYAYKKGKHHYWNCRCDCGNDVCVNGTYIRSGNTKSCGCAKRKLHLGQRKYDLTGIRFGFLTAISPENHSNWDCICDCGNHKLVKSSDLIRGFTTSCGCKSNNFCGSTNEREIYEFVRDLLPSAVITKAKILGSGTRKKEIDIFIEEIKLGIEYNGDAFHTSENSRFGQNKDKYYHQDKFLSARNQGIHLITVFEKDFATNKESVLGMIRDCILGTVTHEAPNSKFVYTDNDFDDGVWLYSYGYTIYKQEEPKYYINGDYKVYRCGRTIWKKDNTEVTDEIANRLISTVEHRD